MNQCAFYGTGVVFVRSAEVEDESTPLQPHPFGFPAVAVPSPSMFSPHLTYQHHHRFVPRYNHRYYDNYGLNDNHQANVVVCPRPRRASPYPTGPLLHWRMMSPAAAAGAGAESGEVETTKAAAAYPGAGRAEVDEGCPDDVVFVNKMDDDRERAAGVSSSGTNNTATTASASAAIGISNILTGQLELELASSPPFFSGSPPSRVSNPLIHDPLFLEGLSPSTAATTPSSPSTGGARRGGGGGGGAGGGDGGCVRVGFGNSPTVRIEGFEAGFDRLDRDRSRNCSIPALA